jgi:hypothetical protein
MDGGICICRCPGLGRPSPGICHESRPPHFRKCSHSSTCMSRATFPIGSPPCTCLVRVSRLTGWRARRTRALLSPVFLPWDRPYTEVPAHDVGTPRITARCRFGQAHRMANAHGCERGNAVWFLHLLPTSLLIPQWLGRPSRPVFVSACTDAISHDKL